MNKTELQTMPTKHDGEAFVTINGVVDTAMIVSKCDVSTEAITTQKRFLNQRIEQNAVRGLKVSGNIGFYATTSKLAKAIENFKNCGKYPEITIQTFSTINGEGRFEVLLTGVKISKIGLISLDDSADDETVYESDFTANDFQIIQALEG